MLTNRYVFHLKTNSCIDHRLSTFLLLLIYNCSPMESYYCKVSHHIIAIVPSPSIICVVTHALKTKCSFHSSAGSRMRKYIENIYIKKGQWYDCSTASIASYHCHHHPRDDTTGGMSAIKVHIHL